MVTSSLCWLEPSKRHSVVSSTIRATASAAPGVSASARGRAGQLVGSCWGAGGRGGRAWHQARAPLWLAMPQPPPCTGAAAGRRRRRCGCGNRLTKQVAVQDAPDGGQRHAGDGAAHFRLPNELEEGRQVLQRLHLADVLCVRTGPGGGRPGEWLRPAARRRAACPPSRPPRDRAPCSPPGSQQRSPATSPVEHLAAQDAKVLVVWLGLDAILLLQRGGSQTAPGNRCRAHHRRSTHIIASWNLPSPLPLPQRCHNRGQLAVQAELADHGSDRRHSHYR